MKRLFIQFLYIIAIICTTTTSLPASDFVQGDVLAFFDIPSGAIVTKESLSEGGEDFIRITTVARELDSYVVKFYPSLSILNNEICVLLHSDIKDENTLINELLTREDVKSASHNYVANAQALIPNDPKFVYGQLWGLEAIRAPEAWEMIRGNFINKTGKNALVAVVDSGIDYSQPDLTSNFDYDRSRNFYNSDATDYSDQCGHGTHVAGTIGAVGNNNFGVVGVSWQPKLISLRVLGPDGKGSGLQDALEHIADMLNNDSNLNLIVNMSLGWYSAASPEAMITGSSTWRTLKGLSDTNRVLICVAAGNENIDIGFANEDGEYCYPAAFRNIDNMIVVGASESYNSVAYDYIRADFSNYSSTYVDIAAPGTNIWSTVPKELSTKGKLLEFLGLLKILKDVEKDEDGYYYGLYQGTSMASPHVAGAAALLKTAYPNARASELKAALINGANHNRAASYTSHGFLDVKGAMDYLTTSGVSIDVNHFPDSKFRSYISQFDKDKDNRLSNAELTAVQEISVPNRSIYSLEGIEYFKNIVRLDCSGNSITSLYVSGHSKLNYLNVSNCKSLAKLLCSDNVIYTINLLGCTALKELYCENNVISILNISECTALTRLSCANNPLMKLDLSKCTKLESLNCEENYLTTLDLSLCPSLTEINFQNQTYMGLKVTGNNSVYQVDLKDYMTQTQLSNVRSNAIIGYNANGASIRAFSVSYNATTGIISFKEKPSKVVYIYNTNPTKSLRSFLMQVTLKESAEMPIVAVDLTASNFPDAAFRSYLSKFDRNNNGILDYSELQGITNIEISNKGVSNLDGIKNFTALKTLDCRYNNLTELDLSGLTSLTTLRCEENKNLTTIDLSGCTSLTSFTPVPPSVTSLNLSGCTAIETLDLSKYSFWNSGINISIMSLDVSGCTSLKVLYGRQSYINANGCINLKELSARSSNSLELKGCSALEFLDCGYSNLDELDLTETTELRYLYCAGNALTTLDISNCKALVSLDCGNNPLSTLKVSGASNLKELKYSILTVKDTLRTLDLSGCSALVRLDVYNSSVKKLNLSGCRSLEEIYCYGNNDLTSLNNLGDCSNLIRLSCSGCNINTLYLRNCNKLQELRCSSNALAVLDLSKCSALKALDCDNQVVREFKITDMQSGSYRYRFDFRVSLPIVKIDNIARVEGVSSGTAKFFKDGSVTFSGVPKEIRYTYKTGYNEATMSVRLLISSTLVTQPELKNYVLKYDNKDYMSVAYNDFEDVDFSTGKDHWTTIEEKTISSGTFDWANAVVGAIDSSYSDDGALSPYYDVNNSSIIGRLDLFGSIVSMIHGFVTGGRQGITDVKMKLQTNGSKNRMLLMYGTPIESHYNGQTLTLSSILINAHSGEMAYFLRAGDDADKVIRSIFKGLNEGGKYNMWITFSKTADYKNSPYKYSIVIGEDGKVYQYPIIHNNTKFEVYYQPENGDSSFAFDATALIASEKIAVEDQVGKDIISFLNAFSDVAPTITTTQLSTGTVGRTYQETLTSSGTTPITWTIEKGKLPDNLSLNKDTGQITGTPRTADTFNFTVKAQNSVGSHTKEFTIKIDSAPTKPTITTSYLPNGTVGTPYGENISFTGTEPITWSIANGKLPDNLALVNGRISGRPSRADTYTFTVQASNRAGSDTKTFTIKISSSSDEENNDDDYISDERAEKLRNLPIFTNRGSNTPVQRLSSENASLNSDRRLPQEWNNDENETVLAVLPEIRVYSDGIYLINVPFDEYVSSGTTMIWHAFSDNTAAVSFYKSARNADECAFLDDDDNEITMPTQIALNHVNIAAYFEAYRTYTPVITTYAKTTDDNNDSNDDNAHDQTDDNHTNTNDKIGDSGGGGCNSTALGIATLFFVAVLKSKNLIAKNSK